MGTDKLQEQIQYYRDRAAEYDEWFFRLGRYDRGEAHRQQWFSEISVMEAALQAAQPAGDILELACGTGLWTQHLAPLATHLVAVDAAPEAIAINQQRIAPAQAEYIVADLFNWAPSQTFDFIFFGFWLSHVPPEKFKSFWQMLKRALKPQGRLFFVDNLMTQQSTARDHAHLNQQGYAERKLNDGRTYHIVKVFYDPVQLREKLQALGWQSQIDKTGTYFVYGSAWPE